MADLSCSVCNARPFPTAGERQDFDLMHLDANALGVPGDNPSGAWFCSEHFERVGRDRYRIIVDVPPTMESKPKPKFSTAAAAFADLAEDYKGAFDQLVADLGHDSGNALEAFNWTLRRALHRVEEALNGH